MGRHQEKTLSACSAPIVDLSGDEADIKKTIRRFHEDGMGTSFNLDRCDDPVKVLIQLNQNAIEDLSRKEQERPVGNNATLDVRNPKIKEFISVKTENPNIDWKFNLSVTIPNEFFSGSNIYPILEDIARSIFTSGEPGVIFSDILQSNNPLPDLKYESVATCGEIGLAPGETCVFASIDISRFLNDGKINYDDLGICVEICTRFLDDCLEDSIRKYSYPETVNVMKSTRKIGLGLCGYIRLLMMMDVSYGSASSIVLLESILSFINYKSKKASNALAEERGSFGSFRSSSYFIEQGYLERKFGPYHTNLVSREMWKDLDRDIKNKGLRHSTTIILPPTGRSSLVFGTTPQIEPLFTLITPEGDLILELKDHLTKNYSSDVILKTIDNIMEFGSVQRCFFLSEKTRSIFRTAIEIPPKEHIHVVTTAQRYIDGGISKTVNIDSRSSVNDILDIILTAFQEGLNGITIYRDQTSRHQPMVFGKRTKQKKIQPSGKDLKCIITKKCSNLFCEKKHILKPKIVEGEKYLYCMLCDEYYTKNEEAKPTDKGVDKPIRDLEVIEVFSAPIDASIRDLICPKCNHDKAYTWDRQIGHADEDPHVFTRCMKCGYTEKNTFQL